MKKKQSERGGAMSSTRHEAVYHAAQRCQAASLPLTPLSLRGQKKACRVERQKTGGCFAWWNRRSPQRYVRPSSRMSSVLALSLLKNSRLILLSFEPDRKENADPDLSECTQSHTVTFSFATFALIVGHGPRFALGALPGKLLQHVAQRFDTGVAPMGFGIVPTFVRDGRRSRQSLQAGRVLVARAIISHFCQQPRSQSFACPRQMAEEGTVSMGQKKALNLLVIGGNLFDHRQQLAHQRQHQACFGPCGDGISRQMGLMHVLNDLVGSLLRQGMSGGFQHSRDLLRRGCHRLVRGGKCLQKVQGRRLLHFAEEGEGDRIVGFQARGQLIDQTRLAPDQAILIAGQGFQFGNHWTVWLQAPQIGELRSAVFGQQIGINLVRFGSCCRTFAIHGVGIDGIDGKTGFQQRRNQHAMIGFNDAGHGGLVVRATYRLKSARQFSQSESGMGDTKRGKLMPALIDDENVMMGIGPIYSCKPHEQGPPCETTVPGTAWSPFTAALTARLSNDSFPRNPGRRSAIFLNWSSHVETVAFRLPGSTVHTSKCTACSGPLSRGLVNSLL